MFHRSLEQRAGEPPWVFYEGPPTANGRPGSHHVLSRVFKDIFPRFQTMRGRFVDRRGGWDCHGLPVELEVEKRLGISGKPEIEAYGIAEFNALCRESVLTYLDEWERLTERIGFWIDTDRAYRTMDATYVESVWWSLAELHRRGLLYQSDKVVPYCPRCGTALSSHEVGARLRGRRRPLGLRALPRCATRTRRCWCGRPRPWTLPSNQAAAVEPDVTYAAVEMGDETLILAEPLVAKVLGEDARPVAHVPGLRAGGPRVRAARSRTSRAPTRVVDAAVRHRPTTAPGIVHIAPAFGEDDMADRPAPRLDAPNPVGPDGRFTDAVGAVRRPRS